MANIKESIVIENMQTTSGVALGRVEIQPTEDDRGCIQIWDMDAPDEPQAVWFDIEGAAILRNFLTDWLARDSD